MYLRNRSWIIQSVVSQFRSATSSGAFWLCFFFSTLWTASSPPSLPHWLKRAAAWRWIAPGFRNMTAQLKAGAGGRPQAATGLHPFVFRYVDSKSKLERFSFLNVFLGLSHVPKTSFWKFNKFLLRKPKDIREEARILWYFASKLMKFSKCFIKSCEF